MEKLRPFADWDAKALQALFLRYCVAVLIVVAAAWASIVLGSIWGNRFPFMMFFFAVAVSAWYGGLLPSIVTLVLSVCCVTWLFLTPGYFATSAAGAIMLADLMFVATGGVIVATAEYLRRSRRRVEEALDELHRQRASLESEVRQRLHVENELRTQRDWLDVTLSSIADAVIATDLQGRIVFMNGIAESLSGWTATDAKGQDLGVVFRIAEENTQRPLELSGRVFQADRPPVEVVGNAILIARNGSHRNIDASAAQICQQSGEVIGGVIIFRDITAQRRGHVALQESERRFAALAAQVPVGIFETDAEGRCVFVNDYWSRLAGLRTDESSGPDWIGAVHPEDRGKVAQAWNAALQLGGDLSLEYRLQQPDGSITAVLATAKPNRDAEGRLTGYLGTVQDIGTVKESDRRKDEFLALLGHELRNPLSAILNGVQVLQMIDPETSDASHIRDLIERQASHMSRLTDDLLDVSRISSGKIRLRSSWVNLVELVRNTTDIHRPQMSHNRLQYDVHLPAGSLWIHADVTRLSQVVGNLLMNAIKFTDPGGQVTVRLVASGDEATISVRDTGIGMDAEMLQRVFEPFAQADRSLDRSRGGLGLGLALVRGLVERHGGRVEVHSEGLGRGAEFRVRLPVLAAPPADATARAEPDKPLQRFRMLLIDDRRDALFPLEVMLRALGQEVFVATNGSMGVERARECRPDIVLCDIGLPDMNGYAVAQAIRRDEELRSLYLVALTGYGQEEDRQRALEAGFDYHVTKPISRHELLSILRIACPPGDGAR